MSIEKSNLKYRALTWGLLIIFVIWATYILPFIGFSIIMTIFWGLAAWELTDLLGIEIYIKRIGFIVFTLLFSIISYLYFPKTLLFISILAWFCALYFIVQFPNIQQFRNQNFKMKLGLGTLILAPCWVGFSFIRSHDDGLVFLLFILSLIWSMDTVGYLVGKPWGRHKLVPKLSPGKSIEGVLGGIVFTLLLADMVIYSPKLPFKHGILTLILILLIACFSVIGDLFESLLKRQAGVKDSGHLLPGHGGMLDRMDSTLAAVPLFAFILPWIQV